MPGNDWADARSFFPQCKECHELGDGDVLTLQKGEPVRSTASRWSVGVRQSSRVVGPALWPRLKKAVVIHSFGHFWSREFIRRTYFPAPPLT